MQMRTCMACGNSTAQFNVTSDVLSPSSPYLYCAQCLNRFHYDASGHLLTKPFGMTPLCIVC